MCHNMQLHTYTVCWHMETNRFELVKSSVWCISVCRVQFIQCGEKKKRGAIIHRDTHALCGDQYGIYPCTLSHQNLEAMPWIKQCTESTSSPQTLPAAFGLWNVDMLSNVCGQTVSLMRCHTTTGLILIHVIHTLADSCTHIYTKHRYFSDAFPLHMDKSVTADLYSVCVSV